MKNWDAALNYKSSCADSSEVKETEIWNTGNDSCGDNYLFIFVSLVSTFM